MGFGVLMDFERKDLADIIEGFADAGARYSEKGDCDGKAVKNGFKMFRKYALGLRKRRILCLGDLSYVLNKMGVADDYREGLSFARSLYGKSFCYGDGYLRFSKLQDEMENEVCLVENVRH